MFLEFLRVIKSVLLDVYYLMVFIFNSRKYIYSDYNRVFVLGAGKSLLKFNTEINPDDLVILLNGVGVDYNLPDTLNVIWLIEDKKAWLNYKKEVLESKRVVVVPQDIFVAESNVKAVPFIRSVEYAKFWCHGRSVYYWGGTVAFLAVQIALRVRASHIHLAGIDMYNTNHYKDNYYTRDKEWNTPVVDRMHASMSYILKKAISRGVKVTSQSGTFDNIGVNK